MHPPDALSVIAAQATEYFLVEVRGDPARAAGLLALQGIQNLVSDAPQTLTARLSANDGRARCVGCVRP